MAEEMKQKSPSQLKAEADKDRPKKGFAAIFYEDDAEDKKIIQLLSIAKSVGGVPARKIVELGVKAYMQTQDFKQKKEILLKAGV